MSALAALFTVVFLHYFPADIWRVLTTPFEEMPGED
jgi:hypothetical protein